MKKFSIVLVIMLLMLTTGCNKTESQRYSKSFYNTISYIKEEKYEEANEEVDKITDSNERKIIDTVFLYEFEKKIDEAVDVGSEYIDACTDLISNSYYVMIFGNLSIDEEDQRKIDDIDNNELKPYIDLKDKITIDMLPSSAKDYYNSAFNYIESLSGSCSNIESKLRNNETNPFSSASENLTNLLDYQEKINDEYPLVNIPEEYRILLDLYIDE